MKKPITKEIRQEIRVKCLRDAAKGRSNKELYRKYSSVPQGTIRRWLAEDPNKTSVEVPILDDVFDDDARAARDASLSFQYKFDNSSPEDQEDLLFESKNTLQARALYVASTKYGAGLDYQLQAAVWMSNCRYKLTYTTQNMQGTEKINTTPILPENIDWDNKIVRFNGQEYTLDCLTPDSASAKAGLELLMKLTGTDTASTEDIKAQSKKATLAAEKDSATEVATTSIIMNRPRRKTLEEVIGNDKEDESSVDEGTAR